MAFMRRPKKAPMPDRLPQVTVVTMIQNEAAMLPRWLDFYGAQVGHDNLVVLDHNTTDGSTDDLPCTRYRLPPEPWKRDWGLTRIQLVNGIAQGLLFCNDWVVFADADEFLVPDPDRYDGLRHYLAHRAEEEKVVAPVGLNVLHVAEVEPPLDDTQPLLAQREFVKFCSNMCKPQLKSTPDFWLRGFHGNKHEYRIDPELFQLHLKYLDRDKMRELAEHRYLASTEGRGGLSGWQLAAEEQVAQLDEWVKHSSYDEVPYFDPAEIDLDAVVQEKANGWKSTGSQKSSMEAYPLRRLPERLRNAL